MSIYKEQRQLVRKKILSDAIRIFRDKGYENSTIDEITKAVGIAKGTFYNFFASKSEILLTWAQERFQAIDLQEACLPDETVAENLFSFTISLVRAIEDEGSLFYSFLREIIKVQGEKKYEEQFDFTSIYSLIIRRSQDSALYTGSRLDTKIHVLNSALFLGLINWFAEGYSTRGLENHLQEIIKVCLHGIDGRERE